MRKQFFSIFMLLGAMLASSSCFAMFPVIDVGEIAQTVSMIERLKSQYDILKNQYDTLNNIRQIGSQQVDDLSGTYGWGKFLNSKDDLKQRQWSPETWSSACKGLSGGNNERYHQLMGEYQANHKSMSEESYRKGADASMTSSYRSQVDTNQASATNATYAFNHLNEHLKVLSTLGASIDNATKNKDVKSAMDLNSRIQLEVAYISVEELRMQSILNQQMASTQAAGLRSSEQASEFNQAGEDFA